MANNIGTLANNKYNSGRTQGQNDVKGNPNGYGLYTATQYNNHYNDAINATCPTLNLSFKLQATDNTVLRATIPVVGYNYLQITGGNLGGNQYGWLEKDGVNVGGWNGTYNISGATTCSFCVSAGNHSREGSYQLRRY